MHSVVGWRRDRLLLCSKPCDQIGDLVVGNRFLKGWHLLAAIQNLVSDFFVRPGVVLRQVNERRGFLRAFSDGTVTVGTAFVAKEDGTSFCGVDPPFEVRPERVERRVRSGTG